MVVKYFFFIAIKIVYKLLCVFGLALYIGDSEYNYIYICATLRNAHYMNVHGRLLRYGKMDVHLINCFLVNVVRYAYKNE